MFILLWFIWISNWFTWVNLIDLDYLEVHNSSWDTIYWTVDWTNNVNNLWTIKVVRDISSNWDLSKMILFTDNKYYVIDKDNCPSWYDTNVLVNHTDWLNWCYDLSITKDLKDPETSNNFTIQFPWQGWIWTTSDWNTMYMVSNDIIYYIDLNNLWWTFSKVNIVWYHWNIKTIQNDWDYLNILYEYNNPTSYRRSRWGRYEWRSINRYNPTIIVFKKTDKNNIVQEWYKYLPYFYQCWYSSWWTSEFKWFIYWNK